MLARGVVCCFIRCVSARLRSHACSVCSPVRAVRWFWRAALAGFTRPIERLNYPAGERACVWDVLHRGLPRALQLLWRVCVQLATNCSTVRASEEQLCRQQRLKPASVHHATARQAAAELPRDNQRPFETTPHACRNSMAAPLQNGNSARRGWSRMRADTPGACAQHTCILLAAAAAHCARTQHCRRAMVGRARWLQRARAARPGACAQHTCICWEQRHSGNGTLASDACAGHAALPARNCR